jgi:lysophospholipase L1-like esterase
LWRTIATYSGVAADALYAHVYVSASKTLFDLKAASRPFVTNASIIADGNSLTAGAYATGVSNYGGWPQMLQDKANYSGATIQNFAVSGQTLTQMLSDAATQIDTAAVDGVRNILIAWELRNEIFYNGSVASAIAKYWQYVDARRATGKFDKIVAMGTTPSDITNFGASPSAVTDFGDDGASFSAKVDDANAIVAADWPTHADAFVDLRQASDLAPWSADVSWDGTHLFAHGYATVRDLVDAAISGWL